MTFKPVTSTFVLNTTINTACFAQSFCISYQQTCNLRTGTETLKCCIKVRQNVLYGLYVCEDMSAKLASHDHLTTESFLLWNYLCTRKKCLINCVLTTRTATTFVNIWILLVNCWTLFHQNTIISFFSVILKQSRMKFQWCLFEILTTRKKRAIRSKSDL